VHRDGRGREWLEGALRPPAPRPRPRARVLQLHHRGGPAHLLEQDAAQRRAAEARPRRRRDPFVSPTPTSRRSTSARTPAASRS
jgi:hypothetical protein